MATSDKSNVTKRSDVNRAMSYQEGDANFDELKNVIDDAHANEQNLSDHENASDPHPQYATDQDLEAPIDGEVYVRLGGEWVRLTDYIYATG